MRSTRWTAFALALSAWSCCLPLAAAGRQWKAGDEPDTVLLNFKADLSAADLAGEAQRLSLPAAARFDDLREALRSQVRGRVDLDLPRIHVQRLRLPAGGGEAAVNAALLAYRSSRLIQAAEPDPPIKAASLSITANDNLYVNGHQWYLTATAWPQALAAYNAGSISLPGLVTVAVTDTGVDAHADFASGQLLAGASFVSGEPTTDDLNGHGTFCAGLIGATTGNSGYGIAGAFFDASKLRILPVKVLGQCGSGATSNLVAGIEYALQQGVRVISMSIQSGENSPALESAVDDARGQGVLLVAAAGNDNGGPTSYPAAYSQAMAVGALDHADGRAVYSNMGKLEISAPGGDLSAATGGCQPSGNACCPYEIWSLAAFAQSCSPEPPCNNPNYYDAGAGTSFATPLVAAAAALLFSQDPSRQVEDVQRILMQTASVTAYGSGFHPESGWGKLNFAAALAYQGSSPSGPALKAYNWPNPFNPEKDRLTTLTFFLPSAAPAKLRLLDAGGDLVKQWDLQAQGGMNLVTWDGRNGSGAMTAVGAYTLVVESGGKRVLNTVAVLH